MSHKIDPASLKRFRGEKDWTLKQLENRSGVRISTLNRIEKGKRLNVRRRTVELLCKALGKDEAALAGASQKTEAVASEESTFNPKYQVNVRIDGLSRNAMAMVSRRYSVTPAQIIEIAPFLFFAAAESSLRMRADKLSRVDSSFNEIEALRGEFPHLPAGAFVQYPEALLVERDSIAARDVFASSVDAAPIHWQNSDDDEPERNPLVVFLKEQAKACGDKVSFTDWSAGGSPDYRICEDEVRDFVGGDEQAAEGILHGTAVLAHMPKEILSGSPDQRATWALEKIRERQAAMMKELDLDLLDLAPETQP